MIDDSLCPPGALHCVERLTDLGYHEGCMYLRSCVYNIHVILSHICIRHYIIEGSLEVKLPTIWTVEKQR